MHALLGTLCPGEEAKVPTTKLKDITRLWWGIVEGQLVQFRRPHVETWKEMKLKLEEHFLFPNYEQTL